jgi:hypothetical protein
MDKRAFLAIMLSVAVILAWQAFFAKNRLSNSRNPHGRRQQLRRNPPVRQLPQNRQRRLRPKPSCQSRPWEPRRISLLRLLFIKLSSLLEEAA